MEEKLIDFSEEGTYDSTTVDEVDDYHDDNEDNEDERVQIVVAAMKKEFPAMEKHIFGFPNLRCKTCGLGGHTRASCTMKQQVFSLAAAFGFKEELQDLMEDAKLHASRERLEFLESLQIEKEELKKGAHRV